SEQQVARLSVLRLRRASSQVDALRFLREVQPLWNKCLAPPRQVKLASRWSVLAQKCLRRKVRRPLSQRLRRTQLLRRRWTTRLRRSLRTSAKRRNRPELKQHLKQPSRGLRLALQTRRHVSSPHIVYAKVILGSLESRLSNALTR